MASSSRTAVIAVWLCRMVWVTVGVVGWWALDAALQPHRSAIVIGGAAALVWAAVLVATLVPSVWSLTAVRLAGSLAVPLAGSLFASEAPSSRASAALAVAAVFAAVAAAADTGAAFVNASAYGDEQRFLLRLPARFLLPAATSWLLWAAAVIGGLALVVDRHPLVATVGVAALLGVSWFLLGRFHRLSRRWLVIVPAGLVVHDHVTLAETLMVTRPNVRRIGLALADTEAADLSGPAGGHLLDIHLGEMATALLVPDNANPKGRALHVQSFLVAPTRPGSALAAMGSRRFPVG